MKAGSRATTRPAAALGALSAWLLASSAFALDPARALTQYVQTVWRIEDGLPHNTVRGIRQTPDGYVWLATHAGIARFDGVRFETFATRNSGLRDNEVRALALDPSGDLWAGTGVGGLHRISGGVVEAFDHGIEPKTIGAIAVTADAAVWVGASGGLFRIERTGAAWNVRKIDGFDDKVVEALAVSGNAVFAGTGHGLFRVVGARAERVGEWHTNVGQFSSLYVDRAGRLWVGNGSRVLQARARESGPITTERTFSLPAAWGGIATLLEDRDGTLWIGTYGGGLHRLNGDRLEGFSSGDGFVDHRPWSLLEDREGSLWVGTRGGLAQLREGAAVTFSAREGLPADIARAVFQDSDGGIWLGLDGGLTEYRAGRLRHFFSGRGLPSAPVRAVHQDRRGRLWLGTDRGLLEFDRRAGRVVRVIGPSHGLPAEGVYQIHEDRAGRFWVGTTLGIAVADGGPGTRFRTPPELAPLSGKRVEALLEDRDGGLWIGTLAGGFARWREGKAEYPTLVPEASIGIRSVYEDDERVVYVGTTGGGLFVRRPGRSFVRITTREGLVDESIWSILPDGESLWMSSDRGVFRVSRASILSVADGRAERVDVNYVVGTADGMKSRECNGGGGLPAIRARDGRFWYPTTIGAVAIDTRRLQAAASIPVRIEEVVLDRGARLTGDDVVVPPGTRDVEIHYAGLSYLDPHRIRFRYRLDGYHADWVEAGERRIAFLSNVPAGEYTFRVEAASQAGGFDGSGAMIALRVQPRLAETLPFRVGAVLVLGGAVALVAWLRGRRLRARQADLERLVATRTAELEAANAKLARLATLDDLTGIANHRRFSEVFREEWSRCHRSGEPLSLLFCDIDDFKAYNDTYGHQAGDECLRKVARAIDGAVERAPDLAARYGGEEFVIVLPSTNRAGAAAVAERIRTSVVALDIPHTASRVGGRVTVSIGSASATPSHDSPETPETLIAAADRALYEAKDAGRDRIVHAP